MKYSGMIFPADESIVTFFEMLHPNGEPAAYFYTRNRKFFEIQILKLEKPGKS